MGPQNGQIEHIALNFLRTGTRCTPSELRKRADSDVEVEVHHVAVGQLSVQGGERLQGDLGEDRPKGAAMPGGGSCVSGETLVRFASCSVWVFSIVLGSVAGGPVTPCQPCAITHQR